MDRFLPLLGIALAAPLSLVITWALHPLLVRYALARPNARSSHKIPTPQGGGIAVVAATLFTASMLLVLSGKTESESAIFVFCAALFIALVGAVDDIKSVPVLPRLGFQALAVAIVLAQLPTQLQFIPAIPLWLERGIALLAGVWFVNLVNFMDGLDLMTVAETIPIAGAMVLLGLTQDLHLPKPIIYVAASLGGAMLGFIPFNRPVARVFLGDVGSLPIGLLLGWCLLELAYRGHFVAALLLPLYYLADTTVTMLCRLTRGERIWEAHRSHFYQRATDQGFSVLGVVGRVFVLNVGLAGLAFLAVEADSILAQIALLAIGAIAVGWTMIQFTRPR